MRNELCTLIVSYALASEVQQVELEVFCRRKSTVRSEFYAAYGVGLKPRFVLELDFLDWEAASALLPAEVERKAPDKVYFHGLEYNIYRDYQVDENTIEITVG